MAVKAPIREAVVIDGLDYTMELMPVYIGNSAHDATLASSMMILRSKGHTVHGHDRLSIHNSLGFEHFVGVSNRHKALINHAKKLAMLDQPLLIEGETGPEKRCSLELVITVLTALPLL
ncbi:hypothetical protein ACT691_18755 [Vibrio metschnikovii]